MFHKILAVFLIVLCLAAVLGLVYIIAAKRYEDRVVGANLVTTIAVNIIAVLAAYIEESFVVDVCLVFAVLSFLGVVVLCRLLSVRTLEYEIKDGKLDPEEGGIPV